MIDHPRHQPGQRRQVDDGEDGPMPREVAQAVAACGGQRSLPACRLAPDGDHRGYARRIDEHEDHERQHVGHIEVRHAVDRGRAQTGHEGVVLVVGGGVGGVEHRQRADDYLLGSHAGQQADAHLPVEAERPDGRLHESADGTDVGVRLLIFGLLRLGERGVSLHVVGQAREVAERPHYDGCHQDGSAHLGQILPGLAPHVDERAAQRRQAIGRQFHHKREVAAAEEQPLEEPRHHHGQHYARQIDAEDDGAGMLREERSAEKQVDRQARAARHQRVDQHGEHPVVAVLDGARGHDGGHVAAKAHHQRDERFAVEPHLVHEAVHDEGGPGHISRIFHETDEEEENEDVGQKDNHSAHTADDAVGYQVLERAVVHQAADEAAELRHGAFDHVHRVLAQIERALEHQPDEEKEQRDAHEAVGQDAVDALRAARARVGAGGRRVGLFERAGDEAVARVGEERFEVGVEDFGKARGAALDETLRVSVGVRLRGVGKACGAALDEADDLIGRLAGQILRHEADVALERLDGHVAVADVGVGGHGGGQAAFDAVDGGLHGVAVVDAHVAGAGGGALVGHHHHVEKFGHSPALGPDGGHHGRAEHLAQQIVVEAGAAAFELVVDVEGRHGADAHVDELRRQVEIALDVGGVDHVEHDVGLDAHDVVAHESLFGRIGRDGIGAGQVGQSDAIAAMHNAGLLGSDGHAAVIARVLVLAADGVEERGLAAVGVADQSHRDVLAVCWPDVGVGVGVGKSAGAGAELVDAGGVGRHLDECGLFASERHVVVHYAVFDGVVEWSVADGGYHLASDEAHLDDALAECAPAGHADDDGLAAGG